MTPTRTKGALMKQPSKDSLKKEIETKNFIIDQLIQTIKEKESLIGRMQDYINQLTEV